MKLQQNIENLIEEGADDFKVSQAIKASYQTYLDSLSSLFEENSGKNFIVKHTKSIDYFLKVIYKYTIRKYFDNYSPMQNALPISLIALGSYGREQLCVYSDIDLMIVYKDIKGYNTLAIIESMLSMAWDCGLKLGHRVHEVSDLLPASKKDHTIKTAMIESRFIHGSKFIWIETQGQLSLIKKESQEAFIQAKLTEYYQRHEQKPICLRADVKNGAGGLRDLNAIFWIASVQFHVSRVKDLVPHTIDESAYAKLMKSIDFLFRLRNALHLSAKKRQDTLILELIPDIAKLFNLSQRKVAERTYKALVEVETLSEIFISQITQKPSSSAAITTINKTFYIQNSTLYTSDVKSDDVLLNLKALLPHISKIEIYDISFIAMMREVTFTEKNSKKHQQLLYKLFHHDRLYALFFALYRAQVLVKLFPAFSKIKYLPQFDGYHKYPVDIHSIHTLSALENISDQNILTVYRTLDKEEKALLRLCSFLHDCGKGRRKDHSELGAQIVKNLALSIGFSPKHAQYASILVRYHTLMSNISAREDIYNEKVVYAFNAKIKESAILNILYVLTFSDIESVGPGTYSNFNAKLLKELHRLSLDAFGHDAMISEAGKRLKKEKVLLSNHAFKMLKRSTQKNILSIKSNLLFFKYTPEEITALGTWVEQKKSSHLYKITHHNALQIEILTQDALNLGYLLGKLSHLDISTMDIFRIGIVGKYFKIDFLEQVNEDEITYIRTIVEDAFDMQKMTKLPPLVLKRKEIDIYCNHSHSYARMQVKCPDQKGLIANIITVFDDMCIDIASAKIQTIKNRARNLFLIEKNGNFCYSQNDIINKLTQQG